MYSDILLFRYGKVILELRILETAIEMRRDASTLTTILMKELHHLAGQYCH